MKNKPQHLQTILHDSERALRSSEARFETIIEKNVNGILIVDGDTVIRFANPATERLFGRPRSELVGAPFGFPLVNGETTEIALRHTEHRRVCAEMHVVEITWKDAPCHLITLYDITERKEAEEHIAHLNAVLRAIRNVNQVIARVHDRDTLIQAVCDEMVKTRGYFHAWIACFKTSLARSTLEAAPSPPPDTIMPQIVSTAKAWEDKTGHALLDRHDMLCCIRKALAQAGDIVAIENPQLACSDCSQSEYYGDRGAMVHRLEHNRRIFGVLTVSTPRHFVTDVEERALFEEVAGDIALALYDLELEARHRQAEEELRLKDAAIATSINAIAIFDLDGQLTYINDAFLELWGYETREELLAQPAESFWENQDEIREILAALHEIGSWRGELVAQRKDGTPFHVQLSISQVLGEDDGQPIALMASFLDITQRKRAAAELQRSARLNEMLLDSLPHPAMLIRKDRVVLAANQTAKELGTKVDDYCWRSFAKCKYIPKADRRYVQTHDGDPPPGGTACTFCLANEALSSGQAQHIPELEMSGRTWDVWWIPIDAETYLHYTLDVTERREMERALRASEQKLDQMLQTMADGMVMVDPEGTIIYANPAAEEILEVSRDDILKRYYHEREWRQIDEERQPYPLDKLPLALSLQERRTVKEMEHGIIAPNGEIKWLSASAAPLIDAHGDVYGAVANFRDITKRKEMEQALRNSEQRYRTLFDYAGDAIFVHDLEGHFLDVNPVACARLGYSREELLEMTPMDIDAPEDATRVPERMQKITQEKHIVFEGRHRRRDGTTFPVEVSSRYIEYDGQPAILSTARDITERKEAARQIERYAADLVRSNEELEQFAYVVSHDLQEPARMVSGYLSLLAQRYRGKLDDKADTFIHYAVDGAERMQEMIRALLNLSRVKTRGGTLEPTDSEAIMERTLRVLHRAIGESNATVTHDPLPTVLADRAQLAQVFQNLIANALKFRRADVPPRVHISAQQQDGMWHFSVADNGIGLDPAQAERIFEIFQRLHTREEYPGTGIGLALCQKIVERHGGHIWVESQPGAGATFHFTLPDAPPPDPPDTPEGQERERGRDE
jgi:PAS domain S-box-containing protein